MAISLDDKVGKPLIDEGSELTIYTPNGEELGLTIKVRSYNSKEVQRVARARALIAQKRQARGQNITAEEQETTEAKILQALVVGANDTVKAGKEVIDFSKLTEKQAKLLTKEYPFIVEQINNFAQDNANFYEKIVGN